MGFSDLPQSAQDRIAAAEIEADAIAANADESAKQIVERFQWGADPLGLDSLLYGDSMAVRAAREESSGGRHKRGGQPLRRGCARVPEQRAVGLREVQRQVGHHRQLGSSEIRSWSHRA